VSAHLAAKAPNGLTAADVDLAMSVALGLEKARRYDLAAEAYRSFGEVIARDRDEKIASRAGVFVGNGRRLALVGKPMPLEGTTMDGRPFDWASYRDKLVLVYFWTSTCSGGAMCSHCRAELANIQRHYQLYRQRGFDVVGISGDARHDALAAFLQRRPMPWVTLHEADTRSQPMALRYGVRGRTSILVGKDGKVVSARAGGKELCKFLTELLGPHEAPGRGR